MTGLELSQSLRSGRRVYGTLVTSPSPRWVPMLASMPLDFVFVDTEHIPIGRETLAWMCRAYAAAGLAPIARIASPDPIAACQTVDDGAAAVIAPYVESPEQVRQLVGAVKYRPVKGRKLTAALSGEAAFEPNLLSYVTKYSEGLSVIANIESVAAIAALDQILAVDGLDAVLIGPHDLSCSLGLPEQYEHPDFDAAVVDILRRARAAGVSAGIHSWMSVEREEHWCNAGANLIIHSSDMIATRDNISAEVNALRARMGDRKATRGSDAAIV